jgi:hypothetical protein
MAIGVRFTARQHCRRSEAKPLATTESLFLFPRKKEEIVLGHRTATMTTRPREQRAGLPSETSYLIFFKWMWGCYTYEIIQNNP